MSNDWELVKPETSKVRNQIKNPSLEASVNNWTASGGTFTRSTEQSYEGAYSGKFVAGAGSVYVASNSVNVSNGQSVAAAIMTYRANSTPTGTATLYDTTSAATSARRSTSATFCASAWCCRLRDRAAISATASVTAISSNSVTRVH